MNPSFTRRGLLATFLGAAAIAAAPIALIQNVDAFAQSASPSIPTTMDRQSSPLDQRYPGRTRRMMRRRRHMRRRMMRRRRPMRDM